MVCPSKTEAGAVAYIPTHKICDGVVNCNNTLDETLYCSDSDVNNGTNTCIVRGKEKVERWVRLTNYTRCRAFQNSKNPEPWCIDYMDQTNCSFKGKIGLTCNIRGYPTTVSKAMICHENLHVVMCDEDDPVDQQCFHHYPNCYIHKHHLCNKDSNCFDRSDEYVPVCTYMTEDTCVRRFAQEARHQRIPEEWLHDGLQDCKNGIDEERDWPTCGSGKFLRYVSNDSVVCEDAFVCPPYSKDIFVRQKNICMGQKGCDYIRGMCFHSARDNRNLQATIEYTNRVSNVDVEKYVGYCQKGLDLAALDVMNLPCRKVEFLPFGNTVYGSKITQLTIPAVKADCKWLFGQSYIYASCLGMCPAKCPLTRVIRHYSCPGQFKSRAISVSGDEFSTFVYKDNEESYYRNNFFRCRNERCIEFSQVCNLHDDCGDGSDEVDCSNNFKCVASNHYVHKSQKKDGVQDCHDISDDCPLKIITMMMERDELRVIFWVGGLIGIIENVIVLARGVSHILHSDQAVVLTLRVLGLFVCLGSLAVSIAIILIAVADRLHQGLFCDYVPEWQASFHCSMIGLIISSGTQMMLFCSTALSIIKAFSSGTATAPNITQNKIILVSTLMISILAAVALITVPVLLKYPEDWYLADVYYKGPIKFFIGYVDKKVHLDVLEGYHGRISKRARQGVTWVMIRRMMDEIFTDDYKPLVTLKRSLYGQNKFCILDYITLEKSESKWYFNALLVVNFSCFSTIVLCSFAELIRRILWKKPADPQISKRTIIKTEKLNITTSLLIGANFFWWGLFYLFLGLHYKGEIDMTFHSKILNLIVLFVSSIVNPFIYCDFLRANVTRFARFCVWFRQALRAYNRRMNNVAPAQEFEMKVLNFVAIEEGNEGASGAGEGLGEEEGKLEGIMEEEEVEEMEEHREEGDVDSRK